MARVQIKPPTPEPVVEELTRKESDELWLTPDDFRPTNLTLQIENKKEQSSPIGNKAN